jgi:hypothetical protein
LEGHHVSEDRYEWAEWGKVDYYRDSFRLKRILAITEGCDGLFFPLHLRFSLFVYFFDFSGSGHFVVVMICVMCYIQ